MKTEETIMKKTITFLLLLVLIISVVSCAKTDPFESNTLENAETPEIPRYTALEVADVCDCGGVLPHVGEISLTDLGDIDTSGLPTAAPTKSITVSGEEYEVPFQGTLFRYAYHSDVDTYQIKGEERHIIFDVSKATGQIVSYSCLDIQYEPKIDAAEKTKAECEAIAWNHLRANTNTLGYELSYSSPLQENMQGGAYCFEFRRFVGGVETEEFAVIYVNIYGEIPLYHFSLLGEMKDAPVITNTQMKGVLQSAEEKVKSLCANLREGLTYKSFEITKMQYTRMRDGRYALFLDVDVVLNIDYSKVTQTEYTDHTRLLVYLD